MTVLYLRARMVGVAQLVELRLVMPAVVGSSPIVHPIQIIDLIDFFQISRVDIPSTLLPEVRRKCGRYHARVNKSGGCSQKCH